MSEHGFLQPNPILFELENRKKKSGLAHELGAGAACLKCGGACQGFQLHFWRKVCINCRCGKVEHAVTEESDHGAHFVGKIFDRPLRTRAEECKFIYGEVVESHGGGAVREVTLDWAPPGVPSMLATKYLRSLPEAHLSIQGSEGAQRRLAQLALQFPLHDVEPGQCHQLSRGEIDSMSSYVDNVKRNVAGQGIVQELSSPPHSRPESARRETPSPPPPLPPPPMELLKTDPLSYTLTGTPLDLSPPSFPSSMGTYYAEPYRGGRANNNLGNQPHLHTHIHQAGSTGSSPVSSPSPPPHPTSPPPHTSPTPSNTSTVQQVSDRPNGWSCSGCGQSMQAGSVAIFAERAGKDRCWHPNCFRCSTCGDRLEDLLYFYSKGQLFCGRDFAQLMNIPRCNACDELIFSTEYTGAEGGTWHLKHFCCWVCDAPLAGHKYIAEGGQPHCLPCWQHHHGKVCSSCGQVIDPQGQRVSLGDQHWHASEDCFRCGVCDKSLLGGKMSKRGTTLLCSSDCGQQLARIKQQQAALLSPHRNTASPNPALSPNSSRTSPIPGLVPGLAKLGIQDSPHSPRPGLEDGGQPSPGSCKPRQTARDILATSHYNQTSRDNLSPHRKEDSRENFNQSVRSNLSHHPREGSWDYLSVRDNLSPQKRDNLSPHQRQNSKDCFLPPQQRLSSKDNLLLSQRHKDNLSMHPFPRPGSASSGDCNGGHHGRQASGDLNGGYHGRQGSGDSGRGYNHVRHGSGSSGDSLPPPVQTHHSRAASYSTIV